MDRVNEITAQQHPVRYGVSIFFVMCLCCLATCGVKEMQK